LLGFVSPVFLVWAEGHIENCLIDRLRKRLDRGFDSGREAFIDEIMQKFRSTETL
jgi:hypothetical protein